MAARLSLRGLVLLVAAQTASLPILQQRSAVLLAQFVEEFISGEGLVSHRKCRRGAHIALADDELDEGDNEGGVRHQDAADPADQGRCLSLKGQLKIGFGHHAGLGDILKQLRNALSRLLGQAMVLQQGDGLIGVECGGGHRHPVYQAVASSPAYHRFACGY